MVGSVRRAAESFKPVEIVIKATDNASKGLGLIVNKSLELNRAVNLVKSSFIATGTAVTYFASGSFNNIKSLVDLIERAYALLQRPIARNALAQIREFGTSAVSEMQSFTTTLDAVITGVLGAQKGAALGNALGGALGQELYGRVVSSVNLIDQKIVGLVATAREAPQVITQGLNILNVLPSALAGFGEPIKLFKSLQSGVRGFASGIIGITQELGQFGLGLSALQQLANFGPFNALIQQNIQLREQLLSTQTSLAATNDVLVGGVRLDGAAAAIQALEGPVIASITKMRRESLDLVGVTSKDLVGVYNILAGQISGVGGDLTDASNLTIKFAAALGTLKVPLDQARQEVNSILMGQISSDSYLAKSIGLTNQQVQLWRQQGTLVERLSERLSAFSEGNKIAAQTVGGISSNIQEVFDEILRNAGEPLLDPIVEKLGGVYEFIQSNSQAIQDFVSQIVAGMIEVGEIITRIVARIFEPAADIGGNLILLLMTALTKAARALEDAFNQLYPALEPFINVLKLLAENAETITVPFFTLFLKLQGAKLAVSGLSESFAFLGNLFPFVGEGLAIIDGRTNSLLAQFTNLSGSLGRFGAAGLLAAKNMNSLPGVANAISQQLGFLGPIITPLVPALGGAGIAVAGLSQRFPIVNKLLQDGIKNVPQLTQAFTKFAATSDFAGGILKQFVPQLEAVNEKAKEYTDINKLGTAINEKLSQTAVSAAQGVGKQVSSMALYSGALFALAFAFDNLILKNEGVLAIVDAVGVNLVKFGEKLMNFLQTPAVSATIAIAALVVLIQTGLIPSLLASAAAATKALVTAFADQWRDLNEAFRVVTQSSLRLGAGLGQLGAVKGVQAGVEGAGLAMAGFSSRVNATKAAIAQVGMRKFAIDLAATQTAAGGAGLASFLTTLKTAAVGAFTSIIAGAKAMATAMLGSFNGLRVVVMNLAGSFVAMGKAVLLSARQSMVAARDAVIRLAGALGLAIIQLQAFIANAARTGLATLVVAVQSAVGALVAMRTALISTKAQIATMGLLPFIRQLLLSSTAMVSGGGAAKAFSVGLLQAAGAAKTLITTLGPIALAVVGIAAVTEVIRILHDEFFAGNKVLKEYLKNLRDAEVELENSSKRVNTPRPNADEDGGKYTQLLGAFNDLNKDKNFVQKGFDALRGRDYIESALKQLADEEAGLIELSDAERRMLEATVARDRELNSRQDEVAELLTTVDNRYAGRGQQIADLKAEMDGLVKAFNDGEISEEEFQLRSGEVNKEIEDTNTLLTQEIDGLKKTKAPTEAQSQAIAEQIARYEGLIETLGQVNSTTIEQKDIPRLGTQFEQLAQKAAQAEEAINAAKGDPAIYADQAKSLITTTEQLLNANLITEDEAMRRLALVASNTQLDAEIIGQAQEAITKTMEGQSQERISLIKGEQAQVNQEIKNGTRGQVEGQERLLELVKEEGAERLNVLEQQYEQTRKLREQDLQDSLAEKQRLIDSLKVDLEAAGGANTTTGKSIAGEIAAVEASIAATRAAFNAQSERSEQEYQGQRVTIQSETADQIIQSEETIYQTKLKLIDQAQQLALDAAKKAQNDTDIQNQRLLNSGLITQEQLSARRADSNRKTLETELKQEEAKLAALEALPKFDDPEKEAERQSSIRQSRLRTQELTLSLLESERKAVEENIALLEKDLKDAAKGYSNELETQIQALERQKNSSDELTKAQEIRTQLAEAENNLAKATSGFLTSEFDLLAQTTNSEYRKQQIAQVTATIKLQSARLEAEFARKSLEMEYEQNKLARERELMENRMAVLRAEQAVRQGDAEVRVAEEKFSKGLITESELNEALIKQQGNVDRLGLERQQGNLIRQQQNADERSFQLRAQQGALEARNAERQAQVGLAQALPPGLRERALNQIGEDIAQSFGYSSRADLINSGTALARQTAQGEFGVGQSSGGLSAFDSGLEGLREQLTPAQYAAAVSDTQSRFQRELGSQPFSAQQDQLLGRGASAFQLPGIVLPEGGQQFRLSAGDAQGRDIGFPATAQPMAIAGGETERLISAFQQGGQPLQANFEINVSAAGGREAQSVANEVQRELEKVLDRTRQLVRSGA